MSEQDSKQIDRPVVSIRRSEVTDGKSTYMVLYDNDVTLKLVFDPCKIVDSEGKEKMTGDDLIDLMKLDNDPRTKYNLIRQVGTLVSSTLCESGDSVDKPATESFGEVGSDIEERLDKLDVDDDDKIYKMSEDIVEKYEKRKYDKFEDLAEDNKELGEYLADLHEPPATGLLVIAGYALLFGTGIIDEATSYLKHAAKDGEGEVSDLANEILAQIESGAITDKLPMTSFMFDEYDEDLHKDMLKACKLSKDGLDEEEQGDVEFGMGKEATRKLESADLLTPYDYYCIAVILDQSNGEETPDAAIEKGIAAAEEKGYYIDTLHFKWLKNS